MTTEAATTTPPPQTPSELVLQMFAEGGLPGVYRGVAPELIRGMLSAAAMLMIKERVHGFSQRIISSAKNGAANGSAKRLPS